MNSLLKVIFIATYFHVLKTVKCENNEVLCKRNLIDSHNRIINETTYCKPKPCLISKCKQNEVYVAKRIGCTDISKVANLDLTLFQAVYKYNDDGKLQKTEKSIWEAFNIVRYQNESMLKNTECVTSKSFGIVDGIEFKPRFLENGSLVIEAVNNENQYAPAIVDYMVLFLIPQNAKEYKVLSVRMLQIRNNHTSSQNLEIEDRWALFYAIGMFISCFFMILVLVVYGALKELQNIVGMIVMAFMGTLTCGFLFKASRSLSLHYLAITMEQCKILSPITNIVQVSSFMWMNVLSFDIWWKFRSTYYNRPINRRGVWNKFMWYALYAWGFPILLTIAEVIIDNSDLHLYPKFVKPMFNKCSVGTSNWYLLVPITIILTLNLGLFILTAFNVWRVRKEITRFNKSETKKNKENESMFVLCLKLSVLTGTNWIFDVMSTLNALPQWLETAANIYNAFIGVIIFMALVFKTHIMLKLCRKFSDDNALTRRLENRMNRKMTSTLRKTTETDTIEQEMEVVDLSKKK